eukprot:SAG11_NODE_18280_length_495_cov_1.257576_1_plen_93_part_01
MAWADLVRCCALKSGRKAENLKVYTSETFVAAQLQALGPDNVARLLELSGPRVQEGIILATEDQEFVKEIVQRALVAPAIMGLRGPRAAVRAL